MIAWCAVAVHLSLVAGEPLQRIRAGVLYQYMAAQTAIAHNT
jgi:hypothetical protein